MRKQQFLNILCFTFMTKPKTACSTKPVQPALTTGHTILFLTSLLMFSQKFPDADRHRHLYL